MRIHKVATLGTCASVLTFLTGCGTFLQAYDGEVETSLREPTGYYAHTDSREYLDQLKIPAGLDKPVNDHGLNIPVPTIKGKAMVGENVDVRPPQVTKRSDLGINGQYNQREAVIWFQGYGRHGIRSDAQAFNLVENVIRAAGIKVAKSSKTEYELETADFLFNEFGKPIKPGVNDGGNLRYVQKYRVRVGRNHNGQIGIATALLSSKTEMAGGWAIDNNISEVEVQRFATGFSNTFIEALEQLAASHQKQLKSITIALNKDNNNHMALILDADYDMVYHSLLKMLPKYSIDVKEYSISSSDIKIKVTEEDPSFYRNLGVDPFLLQSGEYIIRLALLNNKVVVTFYDKEDMPLSDTQVSRLYSGFSKALAKEFKNYNKQAIN